MKKAHVLKTDPEPYELIQVGNKTFEIRKDDRTYEEGDFLILRQTRYTGAEMALEGKPLEYIDPPTVFRVSHLMRIEARFGQAFGPAAVMSIQHCHSKWTNETIEFVEVHSEGSITPNFINLKTGESSIELS